MRKEIARSPPGAVLSHASAAHLWSLSPRCPPFIHITVPGSAGRAKRKGIVVHRSTTLTPKDTTLRHGIPVTTRARTKRDMGWLDSYAYHSDPPTFVSDRARDRDLQARGFTPMRFADEELDERPQAIVRALLAALARAA